jgi:cellobiose PTS system EIIC component
MSLFSAGLRPWSANSSLRWFDRRLLPVLRAIADAPPLVAVRDALPWSVVGLVGGLIVLMLLVPVGQPFFSSIMPRIAQSELPAFGVMAISLAVILAYRLALNLNISRVVTVIGTAAVFVLALPRPVTPAQPYAYLSKVGESGLFVAIIAAVAVGLAGAAARRYVRFPLLADVFGASFVMLLTLGLFNAHFSLGNALIGALQPLAHLGDSYTALLVIVVAETALWTLGIHGPATLAAIVTPVYLALQAQNAAAFGAHLPLPHIVVVSLFLFIFPGGAGATLPLAALLAFSKVERLRKIGRLTVVPALFNINEPLVFGLPIVFNPFLAVPFVIVPIVLATISYFAMADGLVARPWTWMPSALPTFASTYLATSDIRAVVLVIVNLTVATLIYIPFLRAYERHVRRAASEDKKAA